MERILSYPQHSQTDGELSRFATVDSHSFHVQRDRAMAVSYFNHQGGRLV